MSCERVSEFVCMEGRLVVCVVVKKRQWSCAMVVCSGRLSVEQRNSRTKKGRYCILVDGVCTALHV